MWIIHEDEKVLPGKHYGHKMRKVFSIWQLWMMDGQWGEQGSYEKG